MKSRAYVGVILTAVLGLSACGSQNATVANSQNSVASPANLPEAEVVASFATRPGNLTVTPSGRILFTNSPLTSPNVKLAELLPDGTAKPYPSVAFSEGKNATLKAAIGIRTTDQGITWVLDMPNHTFHAIDTNTDRVVRSFSLPKNVVKPTSFLQDFALDQKRNRVIIADMTQGDLKSAPTPAFIVVDLDTGKAKRVAESHPAMMPSVAGGFALNPITIDPNYEYIYFGALNGKTVYRVPASAFDGDASTVATKITAYAPKPFNDGMSVDSKGNVYITDVESKGYGVATPQGYRLIAKLPAGQSWPDGLSFGNDGYVYGTVDQLDRSAALSGQETGTGEYLIVRFKPVAPGKRGR